MTDAPRPIRFEVNLGPLDLPAEHVKRIDIAIQRAVMAELAALDLTNQVEPVDLSDAGEAEIIRNPIDGRLPVMGIMMRPLPRR